MPVGAAVSQETTLSFESLRLGRSILRAEALAIQEIAEHLDQNFCRAVELLADCRGSVMLSGMGKAGLIGRKIAATLASTGTPSHFLHPAEAVHGDLGRVREGDVIVVLSYSGETEEVTRLLPYLHQTNCPLVAITSVDSSTLSRAADCVLALGRLREAGPLQSAPSTSTTAMLALGDALALAVAKKNNFAREGFARFHPGGNLGLRLARVEDAQRSVDRCRVAHQGETVRQVLVQVGQPGRRTGAIMLVDDHGRLCGIFTDSDLARLFEERHEAALDQPIAHVMCDAPTTIEKGKFLTEAIELMAGRKISELPVVDEGHRPMGLIDITDVLDPGELESHLAPSTISLPLTVNEADGT